MNRFIFLATENQDNLFKLFLSINGVEQVDKTLINVHNGITSKCIRIIYDSSLVSIDKILNYYLNYSDMFIVYSKNNDGFLDKAAIKYKEKITFSDFDSVEEVEEEAIIREDVVDERVKNYDLYEAPYLLNMNNRLYFIIMFIAGLALVLLGDLFYLIPLSVKASQESDLNNITNNIYNYYGYTALASKILLVGLSFIFARLVYKRDMKDFKKNAWKYIIVIIVSFGLIYASNYLFDFIYKITKINSDSVNESSINEILAGNSYYPFMISIIVFTPIFEEIVFRKFAFKSCKYLKFPKWLAIIVVAFIFAIIHCTSEDFGTLAAYVHLFHYFTLSMLITLPYALCNENMGVSVGIHFLNNLYSSLV